MKKSPLTIVKERFGDDAKAAKEKLIEEIRAFGDDLWLDREVAKGLKHAPNKKLLHLHEVLTTVKKDFGSRAGLIEAIMKLENRSKDEDYKTHLGRHSLPRLLDHHGASAKNAPN